MVSAVAALLATPLALAQSPPSPQVAQGARLYQEHCAFCHGNDGRGGQGFPRPIWGSGHDLAKFGNAQGLFEYLRLLMPFDDPQKLDEKQKLAVLAFMLERNANLSPGMELTAANLKLLPVK
ncbi:MAG: cytochrome c [Burkholderiaceae bacterium]|nr:cytochrome c [Burkholderiaceae bacterium]